MVETNISTQQILLRFQPDMADCRKDLSAIALTSNQDFWLASDEAATIEYLSYVEPHTFGKHQRFRIADFIKLPGESESEIDIEGFDYNNYYLWIVGSHSVKREKPRKELTDLENIQNLAILIPEINRYFLARIPLVNNQLFSSCNHPENPDIKLTAACVETNKKGNLITKALAEDPHLGLFVSTNIPAKENGFDIEGLAVRENKIFLGLRGPVLRGLAMILEIEVKEKNATSLRLRKIQEKRYKKHFVDLGGLGVRELCFDGDNLLVLAGPTMDIDGPVKLFKLSNILDLNEDSLGKPTLIMDIPYSEGKDHAEGIAILKTEDNQKSLLVIYDSPSKQRLQGEDGILIDVFQLPE